MWTRPIIARLQHSPDEIRCQCEACGAHAYAPPSAVHVGRCGNCQSLALVPLDTPSGRAFLTPRAAGL